MAYFVTQDMYVGKVVRTPRCETNDFRRRNEWYYIRAYLFNLIVDELARDIQKPVSLCE